MWWFWKNIFKLMAVSLHFNLKHHIIYSYNPLLSKLVQMNCPDISESKSLFPDKNNLFAWLWANARVKLQSRVHFDLLIRKFSMIFWFQKKFSASKIFVEKMGVKKFLVHKSKFLSKKFFSTRFRSQKSCCQNILRER